MDILSEFKQEITDPSVRNDYFQQEIRQVIWQIPNRYSELRDLGSGAYGRVCSAFDKQLKCEVAIKKLSKPFETSEYAKRTYREISILNEMDHDNILCMVDIFTPQKDLCNFRDVYIVTPFMMFDLSTVIKNTEQELDENHISFFVYQMLRALKYMHSAGLVHRDIKPANIGVNLDLELKILDFGLARVKDQEMTGYIATRWYRAPEVMYSWCHYSPAVDIWSIGCIMAEMYNRRPLLPGSNHIDQLKKTLRIFGFPDAELMNKITSESARDFLNGLDRYPGENLKQIVPTASDKALNMLNKLLVLDPDRRYKAVEALEDCFIAEFHDESDEPVHPPINFNYENREHTLEEWRQMIWSHIDSFRPKMSSFKPGPRGDM